MEVVAVVFSAVASVGAFIVALVALGRTSNTNMEQTDLQKRLASIEEDRRSEEVERSVDEAEQQRLLPASKVYVWDDSTGDRTTIFVHNTSAEPVHDVVCWAWPMLMDAPAPANEMTTVSWPDFPDFPMTQMLWVGSIGPGERKSVAFRPQPNEIEYMPIGAAYEVEFTDGRRRNWNRSHDGTLREDFRRPYAC